MRTPADSTHEIGDLRSVAAADNDDGPALPGTLQVCFVVESGCFAWWGVADPATAAATLRLPGGPEQQLRIAMPAPTGRSVQAVDVPAVLVDSAEGIAGLRSRRQHSTPGMSTSLRAWSLIATSISDPTVGTNLDRLARDLPTAGHCALGLDGTTIWSARATVEAARRCATTTGTHAVHAILRPYQHAGVTWLHSVADDGVAADGVAGGGILADEMGLGKTVQAIAVLADRHAGPHLVVCPTSVLGNWHRELTRFAPDLPVTIHSGPARAGELDGLAAGTVVLTSYGMLRNDRDVLAAVDWDVALLDEAQQIKNPEARTARAARSLHAHLRVAMTGTPVENRLDELWSLLAFTSPGLLGTRTRFRKRFAVAVEQRHSYAAAQRLHELVGPHILRRRKSDVAPELPAKIETTVVCSMTDEQEHLYRTCLDESFHKGFGSGIERRGRVLALLTRLKQICNHPEQVRPTGAGLDNRSGKLDRAVEMLTEIIDDGERALVFTQYRDTGELLARHFGNRLTGRTVPFVHGGLTTQARERLLSDFQDDPGGPPVLILSLRAAGFGLNLTRAAHVLHYDRWWNPAVEDQASDRAHRLGQTRTVTVHTLLTERTLEEAVDDLHAGKRDLAGIVTGEQGTVERDLARLSDHQLRALLEPTTGGR